MALRDQLSEELKAALKARDKARIGALRLIMSELKNLEIDNRSAGSATLSDGQVLSMLRRMVRMRQDASVQYRQAGRPELADAEDAEIAVIEEFLPQEMDAAATEAAVDAAIAETHAAGMQDMGKVIALLRTKHGGVMDMAKAAPLVKAKLAG